MRQEQASKQTSERASKQAAAGEKEGRQGASVRITSGRHSPSRASNSCSRCRCHSGSRPCRRRRGGAESQVLQVCACRQLTILSAKGGVLRSCECPCLVSVSLYNECTVDYSRLATDSGPPGREDRVILIRA